MAGLTVQVEKVLGGPPPAGHEFTAVVPVSSRPPAPIVSIIVTSISGMVGITIGAQLGVLGAVVVGGVVGGLGSLIVVALGARPLTPPQQAKRSASERQALRAAQRQLGLRDHMVWAVNRHNLLVLECSSMGSKQPRRLTARVARRDVSVDLLDDDCLAVRIKGLRVEVWGSAAELQSLAAALGYAPAVGGADASTAASRRRPSLVAIGLLVVVAVVAGVVLVARRSPDTTTAAAAGSPGTSTTTEQATTSTVPHVTKGALAALCASQKPSALSAPYQPGPGVHPLQAWDRQLSGAYDPYSFNPKKQVSDYASGPELDTVQLVACLNRHPVEHAFDCWPDGANGVKVPSWRQVTDVTVYAASTGAVVAQQAISLQTYDSCKQVIVYCRTCGDEPHAPDVSHALEDFLSPLIQTP